jgi:hypothetical protein
MPRLYGTTFLVGLSASLSIISSGNAADRFFEGQWQKSSQAPASIGIIQYGETVAIFSEAGWAMALLQPQSGGMLASGEGRWTLNADTRSVSVNVTIGYRNDFLYLLVLPKDGSRAAEYKIIMERVEPKPTNRRA